MKFFPQHRALFIVSWLLLLSPAVCRSQSFYFRHYQVEQGLTNNTVYACLQDSKGFMWFGTRDGLNRFDGYSFKKFNHKPTDSLGIGSNFIRVLYEDLNNTFWVGTDKGLYRYDDMLEQFHLIVTDCTQGMIQEVKMDRQKNLWFICNLRLFRLSPQGVLEEYDDIQASSIAVSDDGTVWISDRWNSVGSYNPSINTFTTFPFGKLLSSGSLVIEKIITVSNHELLVGTSNRGLWAFDSATGTLTPLDKLVNGSSSIFVRDILRVSQNEFWIASESGIYIYDRTKANVVHMKREYNDPYSLSDNAVYSLYMDTENGIWAGTYFGGVNYMPRPVVSFEKYFTKPGSNSIQGNAIREICKDKYDNLWIGTEDGGLNVIEAASGDFSHYEPSSRSGDILYHNIHALLASGDELWIGTFKHGLEVMNLKSRKIVRRYFENTNPESIESDFVYSLLQTKLGTILAGTGAGLYELDKSSDQFHLVSWLSNHNLITTLFEDSDGDIWIGTIYNDVYVYNPGSGILKNIHKNSTATNLPYTRVNSVYESNDKTFWLCTDNGLVKYDKENDRVIDFFDESKGLPSDLTFKVLQDDAGNLWVTTSKGLARINFSTSDIMVFTKENGLLSDQFNYNSGFQDADGTMYFGSVKGLISFNPPLSLDVDKVHPVLITGIQIQNKELAINQSESPLKKAITRTTEIDLNHDQSTFSLDFSALTYRAPEMTRYAYKMEGLDQDWVYLTNNRKVYFTNLSPGQYGFMVRAVENGRNDSDSYTQLIVTIHPPFWANNFAYTLYGLAFIAGVFLLIRNYHQATERRNARRLELFQNEKEKELYNAKIEFFTNIAHEIKTPLTLINLPLEKIIKNPTLDEDVKKNLKLMEKNTNRLINLSNQLLDFSNTKETRFSLTFVKTDICELLIDILRLFTSAAEEKRIKTEIELPKIHFQAFVDPEATKKILSNLFSNAIKYGSHTLKVSILPFNSNDTTFTIKVSNDGPLIPGHLKEKIFDPFFRVEGNTAEGTGIGLALAMALTKLHKGNLEVKTDDGLNSFYLCLPIHQEKEFQLYDDSFEEVQKINGQHVEADVQPIQSGKSSILLVEDNLEILEHVANELTDEYSVLKVTNGQEALAKLEFSNVQLIISDVMMPVMDGYELCRKVKSNFDFCHIPLILLTAKNGLKDKIEGLELGADAYIEKPFSQKHLNAQIASLLTNRNKIKEYFSNSPLVNIKSVAHSKADETFLLKVTDFITARLGDSNLNVERMAQELNMSRQTLNRKIRGLTNLTPHELITVTKLKKAAELLLTGDHKIYEVADQVGYSLAANFSRDFMKQFGISPTEYMNTKHSV